jgi:hypothetical protein
MSNEQCRKCFREESWALWQEPYVKLLVEESFVSYRWQRKSWEAGKITREMKSDVQTQARDTMYSVQGRRVSV